MGDASARWAEVQRFREAFLFRTSGPRADQSIQRAVEVSEPGDALEQQADRVAERVLQTPAAPPGLRRAPEPFSGAPRREGISGLNPIWGVPGDSGALDAPSFPEPLRQARAAGGTTLPAPLRASMEPHFGASLGQVRVHDDGQASALAEAVNAKAFTIGDRQH